MAENSKIEWTHHTFNPWRGCTKVSAGCANCYAETMSGRNPKTLGIWGPQGTRVVAAESYWREPIKWDREAKSAGERRRVFCASLADVFEDWDGPMVDAKGDVVTKFPSTQNAPITMNDVRARLFDVIDATPNLDWLLLTKRPENISRMLCESLGFAGKPNAQRSPEESSAEWCNRLLRQYFTRPNVWLGTSVENQKAADERILLLLQTPAAVRFLSCEPLLGPIHLASVISISKQSPLVIDWVICGGESGHGSRPCRVAWVRSIVKQCQAAEVPVFVKQLGGNIIDRNDAGFDGDEPTSWPAYDWDGYIEHDLDCTRDGYQGAPVRVHLNDKKGGDPSEWPADLRIRQFPGEQG